MSAQSLRPLGLGEVIDTAFKIYRRHWRALMLLVAVVVIPAGIASYLILDAAVPPDFAELVGDRTVGDPPPVIDDELLQTMLRFLGAAVLAAVIESAAAVLAAAGTVRAVAEIYLGVDPDWRASLGTALSRLPAILVTGLLIVAAIVGLTAGVGLLAGATASSAGTAAAALGIVAWLLLVPWLTISWAPAIPVLVIERANPTGALTRSFALVRRRWWPTFGTLLTAWLIAVVLSGIASRILQAFLPGDGSAVGGILVSLVISIATTPFIVCVLAVLYFDLRTRHEPFSLQRLAGDIGVPPPLLSPEPDGPESSDRPDWPPLPPDPGDESLPPLR